MLKEHKMEPGDHVVITLPDSRKKFRGLYITECSDAIRLGARAYGIHFHLSKGDLNYRQCRKGTHYLELTCMPILHNMHAFEEGIQ